MISTFPAPVLAVAADAVRDLEGGDALSGLWALFSKCKESVKDGRRLENISWRLWYRELAAAQAYRPLTPDTSSPAQLEAGKDFPFYAPEHSPTADLSLEESTQRFVPAPLYGSGLCQQHFLAPPMASPDRSSATSSPHGSSLSISIGRLKSTPSVGKFIVDMLPNSAIEPMRLPSSRKGALPSPCSDTRDITEPHKYVTLPAVCLPSTPPSSDSAPRVVVVNPTPHPTPPATPILNHGNSAARGHQLPSTHLLPPLPAPALMTMPPAQTRPEARLSPPRPSRPVNTADETLKASDRRFFLQNSPERISPTDIDRMDSDGGKVIAASDGLEASSGGSSQMHMKGSAESNRPVVMKRKGKEAVRHVGAVRPNLRRGQSTKGGTVRRQASTDGKAHRPTFNIGSSSSHGSKVAKDAPAPLTKAHSPSPPPPPPPVNNVKPSAPKKRTLSPIKPATTQKTNGRRVVVASSASDSDFETDSDDDSWCSEELSAVEEPTKESKEEIRLREAALEAQRQREMFAKVPKRSYSNLDRSRSGLLSALLNPDPKIFPPNHPYRTSHSTQDMTQLPRRGNALSGLAPMAPLSTSKSTAALPQAVQATVRAPRSGLTEAMGKAQIDGGYQSKGRPNQEMEMDTDSEDDNPDDKIQVSKSVAQERLAALAGRRSVDRGQPTRQQTTPAPARPTLPTVTSAPIPFGHPYNLPAPSAPSTPRTTRRQMLSTELSESLRRNLLWERQVSKNVMVGQRRQSATALGGGGVRPMTGLVPGETSRNGGSNNNPAVHLSNEDTERAESKRRAMARNRSWADDYHYSGW